MREERARLAFVQFFALFFALLRMLFIATVGNVPIFAVKCVPYGYFKGFPLNARLLIHDGGFRDEVRAGRNQFNSCETGRLFIHAAKEARLVRDWKPQFARLTAVQVSNPCLGGSRAVVSVSEEASADLRHHHRRTVFPAHNGYQLG